MSSRVRPRGGSVRPALGPRELIQARGRCTPVTWLGLGQDNVLSTRRSLPWSARLSHGCGQLPCLAGQAAQRGPVVVSLDPSHSERRWSSPRVWPCPPLSNSRVPRAVPASGAPVQGLGGSGWARRQVAALSPGTESRLGDPVQRGTDGSQHDWLLPAGMELQLQRTQGRSGGGRVPGRLGSEHWGFGEHGRGAGPRVKGHRSMPIPSCAWFAAGHRSPGPGRAHNPANTASGEVRASLLLAVSPKGGAPTGGA